MSKGVPQFSYSLNLSFNKSSSTSITSLKSNLEYVKINNDYKIKTNSTCPSDLVSNAVPRALQQVLTHYGVEANKVNAVDLSSIQEFCPNTRKECFATNDSTFSDFQRIKEDSIFNSTALSNTSARKEKLLSRSRILKHGPSLIEKINDKVRTKGKKRKQIQCNAVEEDSRQCKQMNKFSRHHVYDHHDGIPQYSGENKFFEEDMNTAENNCDNIVKSGVDSIETDDKLSQSINLKSKLNELYSENLQKERKTILNHDESLNGNSNNHDGEKIETHLIFDNMNNHETKYVEKLKYLVAADGRDNDHIKEDTEVGKLVHPVSQYVDENITMRRNTNIIIQANIANIEKINPDMNDELYEKQTIAASIGDGIEQLENKKENGQYLVGRNTHQQVAPSDCFCRKENMENHNNKHALEVNEKKNVNCDMDIEKQSKNLDTNSPKAKFINGEKLKQVVIQNIEEPSNETLKLGNEIKIVHSELEFTNEQSREVETKQKNDDNFEINNDGFKDQKNLCDIHSPHKKNFNLLDKMQSDIQLSSGYLKEKLKNSGQAKQNNEILENEMKYQNKELDLEEHKNSISPVLKICSDTRDESSIIIGKDVIEKEEKSEDKIEVKADADSTLFSPPKQHINVTERKSRKMKNDKQILEIDNCGIMSFDQVNDENNVEVYPVAGWNYENGKNVEKSTPNEIHEETEINVGQNENRNRYINSTEQQDDNDKNDISISEESEKKQIIEIVKVKVDIHQENQIQNEYDTMYQNILSTSENKGRIFKKKKEIEEVIKKHVTNEHPNLDTKGEKSMGINDSFSANKYKKGRKYRNILIQSILMEKMIHIMQSPSSEKLQNRFNKDPTPSTKNTLNTDHDNVDENEKFLRKRKNYKKLFNVNDEYEPDTSIINGCTRDSNTIMEDGQFNNNPTADAEKTKKGTTIKKKKERGVDYQNGNINLNSNTNGVEKHSNIAVIKGKQLGNELDFDENRKMTCTEGEKNSFTKSEKGLEEETKISNKGNEIQSNGVTITRILSETGNLILKVKNLNNYNRNKSTDITFNGEGSLKTVPKNRYIGTDELEGKKIISNKKKIKANRNNDKEIIPTLRNENVNTKKSVSKIQLDEHVSNILAAKFKSFLGDLENKQKIDTKNQNVASGSEHSRKNDMKIVSSVELNTRKNISANTKTSSKSIQPYDCSEIQDSEEDYNHFETDSEEDPEMEYREMQSYTISPEISTFKASVKHPGKVDKANNKSIISTDDDINMKSLEEVPKSQYKELQYCASPHNKESKDTAQQTHLNKEVITNTSNINLPPHSGCFGKYDRQTYIAPDDVDIGSSRGNLLVQSQSPIRQNVKSNITSDDDDMDLESIGRDTQFEYREMQSIMKSPQDCVYQQSESPKLSAQYDKQFRSSNEDIKTNSSSGILLLHSHSIKKQNGEINIASEDDMVIELPPEDPELEYIDIQAYVESKNCLLNSTVGNLTHHSNSIYKQINVTNVDNDDMEIESLGEMECRKSQDIMPLQTIEGNIKNSQSFDSDDFSKKSGNKNIVLSPSVNTHSIIDYNDVLYPCNSSETKNNESYENVAFLRNTPELTPKKKQPYVIYPQNGTYSADFEFENQEMYYQLSPQQSKPSDYKNIASLSPNSAHASSVLFFSENINCPPGMSPQTGQKNEECILSNDINRPNEYHDIIADIEQITKNSAEYILNTTGSTPYSCNNDELNEIPTCIETFIPNNFKPRTEINLTDSESHSEVEHDASVDKNEKAQSYIDSFIQQSKLLMDIKSEVDDSVNSKNETGPVQLQTEAPGIQQINSNMDGHLKQKISQKVPKKYVIKIKLSKNSKQKSIDKKNQNKCSDEIKKKKIKTPKNKKEKVQKKKPKHNENKSTERRSILEFFKKETESSGVYERNSASHNTIAGIDSKKTNNNMDEMSSPLIMMNGEICNAESNKELGVAKNVNSESNSKIDNAENSYTFADILSQSNTTRLEKEFEDILDEASRNDAYSDLDPDYDDSSSTNSSDIDDTPVKPRKKKVYSGKTKVSTLKNSEAKNTKKKVIKLIKQSKSIWEIHEELHMQEKDQLEQKIRNLNIENPYSLSRIQKIAPYIVKPPSERQKKKLREEGIDFKLGYFSEHEDYKIKKNWKEFCKLHDWDENDYQPFVNSSKRSKYGVLTTNQTLQFIQFLSHGFENRTMSCVYSRFRKIFSSVEHGTGRFTEEDDEIIIAYMKTSKSSEPYADLATILKRPKRSIHRRYKLLQTKTASTKIQWDKDLGEKLLVYLIEATCSINLMELKNRSISIQEWLQVSKQMGLPVDNIKRSWYINFYPRYFTPNYFENIDQINQKLIDVWKEVDWSAVSKELDVDFPAMKCSKTLRDLVRNKVPSDIQRDLGKALRHLKGEDLSSNADRFSFVMDILKETDNGTKLPRIK